MPLSLKYYKVAIYADDTSIKHTSSSIDNITNSMSTELKNLKKWLHGNKLALNVAKVTCIIIGTNRSSK